MNRKLLEKIQSKVNVKDILKRIPEKSPTVLQAVRRRNKFVWEREREREREGSY